MRIPFLLTLLTLAFTVTACKDNKDDDGFPVWILHVNVRNSHNSSLPINSCARVFWNYSESGEVHDESCRDGNAHVKIWDSIDGNVTVVYRVECEGFYDSGDYVQNFYFDNATQNPGRDGQEITESVTVYLDPL